MKDNKIAEVIAQNLRELRRRKNVTQTEVAKALGVPVSTYNAYELGENIPRDGMKIKIAEYFGLSVQYIFFRKTPIKNGRVKEGGDAAGEATDSVKSNPSEVS